MQREQPLEEQAAKQARQHPHMQEEPWATANPTGAVRRLTPAGDVHVDMGMVRQRGPPGVQHAGHADLRAEALVAEIRDLVVMAWSASQSTEVGFPPVTVSDVIGGANPTTALFGRD